MLRQHSFRCKGLIFFHSMDVFQHLRMDFIRRFNHRKLLALTHFILFRFILSRNFGIFLGFSVLKHAYDNHKGMIEKKTHQFPEGNCCIPEGNYHSQIELAYICLVCREMWQSFLLQSIECLYFFFHFVE